MNKGHTFHIPVMGTGFTIDTPSKTIVLYIDGVAGTPNAQTADFTNSLPLQIGARQGGTPFFNGTIEYSGCQSSI